MKQDQSPTMQSLGGQARAEKLTRQRRSEIAKKAAEARWTRQGLTAPLVAHYGAPDRPLKIGDIEIPCYVLSDKTRVLAQRGLQSGIGMSEGGGKRGARRIAELMTALSDKGIDVRGLVARANSPIRFTPPHGGNPADGYEATILPDICAVLIDAGQRLAKPGKSLKTLAQRAAILQHGFATVGIIALVDEATGYQQSRDIDALQKILDRYVGKELALWAERFRQPFYEQMFRLKGWKYNPGNSKRPMQMAQITLDLVYDRIGPGLTKELKIRSKEIFEKTGKKGKLHQVMTTDVGHPALADHLAGLVFLGKSFPDGAWDMFHRAVDRSAPKFNSTLLLDMPDVDVNADPEVKD